MRISSSLLARQPTELLRFRNAKLRTQTTTTYKVGFWEVGNSRGVFWVFRQMTD